MPEEHRNKLDGWKAIADYLGKDTSTATRWARKRGMPVHRVPGAKGATVYAYTDELDAWLLSLSDEASQQSSLDTTPNKPSVSQGGVELSQQSAIERQRLALPHPILLMVGFALLISFIGLLVFASRRPILAEQVSLSGKKLLAWDERGQQAWEYEFPQRPATSAGEFAQKARFVDLDGDGESELLVIVPFVEESLKDILRQELYCFSARGEVLWRYKPNLTLNFAGRQFEGPWYMNDVLVYGEGKTKTIWLAMAHNSWWPSFVVKLDSAGYPTVQFVNSGAIYKLNVVHNDTGLYILACGLNNEYSAGALAVFGADQAPSTSPQTPGSAYQCDTCPQDSPHRYFLFPRSELNMLQGGPYNPLQSMHVFENYVELWADEVMPGAQLLFQLSKDFDIQSVSMSDGYAELHRRLSQEGRILHSLHECPMLSQTYAARMWGTQRGWIEIAVHWAGGQRR